MKYLCIAKLKQLQCSCKKHITVMQTVNIFFLAFSITDSITKKIIRFDDTVKGLTVY